jgi:hypothetical protein
MVQLKFRLHESRVVWSRSNFLLSRPLIFFCLYFFTFLLSTDLHFCFPFFYPLSILTPCSSFFVCLFHCFFLHFFIFSSSSIIFPVFVSSFFCPSILSAFPSFLQFLLSFILLSSQNTTQCIYWAIWVAACGRCHNKLRHKCELYTKTQVVTFVTKNLFYRYSEDPLSRLR